MTEEQRHAIEWAIGMASQHNIHKEPLRALLAAGASEGQAVDESKVICPACVHQFHAIPVEAQAELTALRERVAGLEAARIAYASEFALDEEGLPDVGRIHQNIRELKARIAGIRMEALKEARNR